MKSKEIDVNGKLFTIKKFSPKLGVYWAFQVLGSLASGLNGDVVKAIQDFLRMSPDKFDEFQADCLKNCYFKNESGTHAMVNHDGSLAYPSELTAPEMFQLIVQSFGFTLLDFFPEAQQKDLLGEISELLQRDGKETSSSSQSQKDTGSKENSGTEPTT